MQEVKHMDKRTMTEYIKVNFPLTEEEHQAGNGEGMWVLVDKKTKHDHDTDATGGQYVGVLDNDSLYYPGLNAGAVVQFEMRGKNRPVADYHGFLKEFPNLTPAGKAAVIRRIAEANGLAYDSEEV
jgi:hypothetical protein